MCILIQTHVSIRTRYKDCPKARGEHIWRSGLLESQSSAVWEVFSTYIWSARSHGSKLGHPFVQPAQNCSFVPFFLTWNAFIKMRNRCIFLHPNQTGYFSDACFRFASASSTSQMSAEKVHQPKELRQNNEMLLGYMSVKQTFLPCQPSLCSRRTLWSHHHK